MSDTVPAKMHAISYSLRYKGCVILYLDAVSQWILSVIINYSSHSKKKGYQNSAFFDKKDTIGHQNEVVPLTKGHHFAKRCPRQNGAPMAPFIPEGCHFNKKGTILLPLGYHFPTKKFGNSAPGGTKIVPLCKRPPFPTLFLNCALFLEKTLY